MGDRELKVWEGPQRGVLIVMLVSVFIQKECNSKILNFCSSISTGTSTSTRISNSIWNVICTGTSTSMNVVSKNHIHIISKMSVIRSTSIRIERSICFVYGSLWSVVTSYYVVG